MTVNRTTRQFAALGLAAGAACSPVRVPPPPPPLPASATQSPVSRAAMIADIDSMLATIERVHPNPYTVVSRDSVRALRDAIVARLPDSSSRMAAWPSFARLVAAVGDGHTSVATPGDAVLGFMARGGLMFPARTAITDSASLTVIAYAAGDSLLHRGDQIVAVNGRPVDSLLRAFAGETGGESERWREQVAARQFESYLLLNGIRAPFTVDVRASRSTVTRQVSLPGIGRDSLMAYNQRAAAARQATTTTSRNFTYRKLGDGTAYMNLLTLSGDLGRFRADLDRMFEQVRADSAHTLVVDLRSNGGGDSRLGDELLSHITAQPYRMDSAKLWKMSGEYRAYMKSMLRTPLNHLPVEKVIPVGRRLFSGPEGTIVRFDEPPSAHDVREPRFEGAVCVLIGPLTFSSAVDLADGIKTYKLATLVGEETGGRPNTFGEVYYFRMPATGFLVGVSSAEFVRANGDTTDRRGVLPDIEVRRSSEDVRTGRDPALDRARSCQLPVP